MECRRGWLGRPRGDGSLPVPGRQGALPAVLPGVFGRPELIGRNGQTAQKCDERQADEDRRMSHDCLLPHLVGSHRFDATIRTRLRLFQGPETRD